MASSRSTKLSKLKAFRHEEDHDYTYVDTFNTIHKQFDRISESSVNYEDGQNFQALYVDSECDFEGFNENESVNFKEYTDRFVDMFLQNEAEEDEIDNSSQDAIILNQKLKKHKFSSYINS